MEAITSAPRQLLLGNIFVEDHADVAITQKRFGLQSRRFLGNKFKLLGFIESIIAEEISEWNTLCDIFGGTGVVGNFFNRSDRKIIANDLLFSNYAPLSAFLQTQSVDWSTLLAKLQHLNNLPAKENNYFSKNFGGKYFTLANARKIGAIRDEIENISTTSDKAILLTSLIYAADKVANTVGHYDAYRKKLDNIKPVELLVPDILTEKNRSNEVYNQDANRLIENVQCDILYLDPPYNSRQYSDAYHLLENLVTWEKPDVHGKAGKMNRSHIKSNYCNNSALEAFADLIGKAQCAHILLSYNNTGDTKNNRSNARISDVEITDVLSLRGPVKVYERKYQAFTTGKSETEGHTERVFYCRVIR